MIDTGSLRRRLLSRSEIGAAFGAGEHFVRVATQLRIEHSAEHPHGFQVINRELFGHEVDLLHSDPVLACDASAKLNAFVQNIVARLKRPTDLVRVALIVKDKRMDVAVAGMKNVWN